jgi:hypothetical protein
VYEDLADHVRLVGLDEGNDLHGPAALGAYQRLGLVDVLDENGPPAAVLIGHLIPRGAAKRPRGWGVKEETELLKMAMAELNFGARVFDKILRVSRTIADLAGSERIKTEHLSEAVQYRSLDRDFFI